MTQTWKINGQVYTHGQLMELRAQGLNPLKDQIVMAAITPRKEVEVKKEKKVKKVEVKKELPTAFFQLKALAKEKGMEVTKETNKEEIEAFLEAHKEVKPE